MGAKGLHKPNGTTRAGDKLILANNCGSGMIPYKQLRLGNFL
jgi:hypothetical protein